MPPLRPQLPSRRLIGKHAAADGSSKVDAMSSSVNDLKTTTAGSSETVVVSRRIFEDEINSPI